MGDSQLLTIADVAQILACSEANVYALIDAGELPRIRVGRMKGYRIDARDLAEFIRNRKETASLEESVGEFWFGESTEVVIEGDFVGFLGAKTV